jgi:hypothetical protein
MVVPKYAFDIPHYKGSLVFIVNLVVESHENGTLFLAAWTCTSPLGSSCTYQPKNFVVVRNNVENISHVGNFGEKRWEGTYKNI